MCLSILTVFFFSFIIVFCGDGGINFLFQHLVYNLTRGLVWSSRWGIAVNWPVLGNEQCIWLLPTAHVPHISLDLSATASASITISSVLVHLFDLLFQQQMHTIEILQVLSAREFIIFHRNIFALSNHIILVSKHVCSGGLFVFAAVLLWWHKKNKHSDRKKPLAFSQQVVWFFMHVELVFGQSWNLLSFSGGDGGDGFNEMNARKMQLANAASEAPPRR